MGEGSGAPCLPIPWLDRTIGSCLSGPIRTRTRCQLAWHRWHGTRRCSKRAALSRHSAGCHRPHGPATSLYLSLYLPPSRVLARPAPAYFPVCFAYRPVDGKLAAVEGGESRQFFSMRGEEMLRKSRTRRNAGLRRRAPPRPAVPRCQPARRRSRNTTGTDDGAALAARPRPGGQEGGAEQRHRRAAVLCTRLGRSRRQISPRTKSQRASDSSAE